VNREEKASEQDEVYETMYKVIHCEKGALKSQVSLLENADTENVSKNQDIMHRWKMQVLRMQVGLRVRMGGKRKIENASMKLQGWTYASTEYLSIRLVLYIRANTVYADYKINGKWLPRALESVSIASALSTALTIYPCQIRVLQR